MILCIISSQVGVKEVKIYIDDIIVLAKDNFNEHIDHLKLSFHRLLNTGLKFSAPNSSFWFNNIPYLSYTFPWRGLNPIKINCKV